MIKVSTKLAMQVLAAVSIICGVSAVILANEVRVGVIIVTGILSALMVGFTYITATKKIVAAATEAGEFDINKPLQE